MKPDVVVVARHQTVLFTPQNHRAAEWLHRRCGLTVENISGDTEIRVHPRKYQGIIAELEAAGFVVAGERGMPA
jgi:acyl-coenzyme A synthetase/AMP-(fatty) acid ligase